MFQIHARQIKAARALLDWSQDDLAKACGLSISTIRNLELGSISPRNSTYEVIRGAIENAGLELIEPGGVRHRLDEVKIYQGAGGCNDFYFDLLHEVASKGCCVHIIIKSQEALAQTCGVSERDNLRRLEQLSDNADIKCLLFGETAPDYILPGFQFRTLSKKDAGPIAYFVYGEKVVLLLSERENQTRYILFHAARLAQAYRNHFLSLWEESASLFVRNGAEIRAAG